MPLYTDPSTGRKIRSSEALSDADLEEAFGGGAPPTAEPAVVSETTTPRSTTPRERAGEYLYGRANQFVTSLQNLQADITDAVTGSKTTDPERGTLNRIGDVATVAGPIVAPVPTALGLLVGTHAAAGGASPEVAGLVDLGVNLAAGGVRTGAGVAREVTAEAKAAQAAAAARRAQAVENVTAGLGEAGEAAQITRGAAAREAGAGISEAAAHQAQAVENVAAGIREAGEAAQITRGAAAGEAAAGISEAAQTARAAETIEQLPTATTRQAGRAVQETLPAREAARRSTFQEGTYQRIAKYAESHGLNATAENPVGQTLVGKLKTAEDEWGTLANTAEHKQVRTISDALTKEGGSVTWQQLDDAEKALQRVRGPSSIRAAIADAKAGLLEGTPAAKALQGANQQWRLTIVPARRLAAKIAKSESAVQAFQRTVGTGKDPHTLELTRKLLIDDHPEAWNKVVGGFFSDLVKRAKGDPIKAARLWQTVRPEIKEIVDPAGKAGGAFDDLLAAGARGAPVPPALPEVPTRFFPKAARGAPVSPTLPEVPTRFLPEAAKAAERTTLGTAHLGLRAAGGAYEGWNAIQKFYTGDWKGGLEHLGIGVLLSRPDLALKIAKGGARPAAEALVGATPPALNLRTGETTDEFEPLYRESTPPPPESTPPGAEESSTASYPSPAFLNEPIVGAAPATAPPARPSASAPPRQQSNLPIYAGAKGFVFHHSGGDTLEGLRKTLKERGLGSQYLMDRDGTIYSFAGPGSPHMRPNDEYGGKAPGLSNQNAIGMEIVARDDSDVTPAQVASARRFIAQNYPKIPVYGHGEVNPGHKQATEGMTVVNDIRNYRQGGGLGNREWDTVTRVIGVPEKLMRSVMQRESAGDPTAISKSGARGLFQIKPHTFELFRPEIEKLTGRPADIDDPLDNFIAGTLHMRDDLKATNGNVELAARRYNAGPDPEKQNNPTTFGYARDVTQGFGQDRV